MRSWKFFWASVSFLLLNLIIWRFVHINWLIDATSGFGFLMGVLAYTWPWPRRPGREPWGLGGTPPTPRELETNRFLYDRTAAVLGIIVGFINLVFLIK